METRRSWLRTTDTAGCGSFVELKLSYVYDVLSICLPAGGLTQKVVLSWMLRRFLGAFQFCWLLLYLRIPGIILVYDRYSRWSNRRRSKSFTLKGREGRRDDPCATLLFHPHPPRAPPPRGLTQPTMARLRLCLTYLRVSLSLPPRYRSTWYGSIYARFNIQLHTHI